MNISKLEQRVLHALAQGGAIHFVRLPNGKLASVQCFTREGYGLAGCTMAVVERLRRRRFIRSTAGRPYRITPLGNRTVRSQLDNR